MNDRTRNAFASYGLEILKQSVLLVLYEHHVHGEPWQRYLQVKQVRERLGIRQVPGSGDLVRSILNTGITPSPEAAVDGVPIPVGFGKSPPSRPLLGHPDQGGEKGPDRIT